jgi:hypothetical protein
MAAATLEKIREAAVSQFLLTMLQATHVSNCGGRVGSDCPATTVVHAKTLRSFIMICSMLAGEST